MNRRENQRGRPGRERALPAAWKAAGLLLAALILAPSGAPQDLVQGLFRPSKGRKRAVLGILQRRGGPSAGADLVRFLSKEKDRSLKEAALRALEAILPWRQARALEEAAWKEEDLALKKAMLEAARRLRLAGELERALPSPEEAPSAGSGREGRKALLSFLGRRKLTVLYAGPRRPGERVLVRVWSPRVGLWLPPGPGGAGRWKKFVQADREGKALLDAPGGPVLAAAWTPRALAWSWVPSGADRVVLRAEREKWGDLGRWKGQRAFLEAWPAGPRPSPGFPVWRVPPSGRFRFFCPKENRLDLLIRVLPRNPGGDLVSRHPGLFAFVRGVGPGEFRVGSLGRLSVSGAPRRRIASLWVDLEPALRPDLARGIAFPPGGGLLALTAGEWRAALGWRTPQGGLLFFHPRGIQVKPGGRAALATLPLRISVYPLVEKRLGAERNILTVTALFRTPDGSVLGRFFPGKGGKGVFLRAYRREIPFLGLETDRLLRGRKEGCRLDGKGLASLSWRVFAPFLAGPPPQVRGQALRAFRGKHYVLVGPSALARAAPPFLALAERAFRTASQVVTGRRPAWKQVPVLAHNFLPPGVGASAGGGAIRKGRMNFRLHDLLSVALPSDFFRLPWVHEQGHKLGYPHDAGMAAQTVETLWTLAGEEGAECSGRFACLGAWATLLGRPDRRPGKRIEAFALFRRRYGGAALRKFLHEQERFRWFLEGEGIGETAAALAALSWIAGKRVDAWFGALGWRAPAEEVERGIRLLSKAEMLPESGLGKALRALGEALVKGAEGGEVLKLVRAVRTHRERALAALQAARKRGRFLEEKTLRALLLEALRAGRLTIPDTERRVRRGALALWVRLADR